MPKIQKRKSGGKGGFFITIPYDIMEDMEWKEQDLLYIDKIDGKTVKLAKK